MTTQTKPVHEPTTFEKAEDIYNKYNKFIIAGLVVIVLIVGFFVYRSWNADQQEKKAQPLMAAPQSFFGIDSFRLALQGTGQNMGFLGIIDKYPLSNSANLAHYYAGVSYLQLGDYQNAIDHLEDFDTDSDIIGSRAYEALGHAYAELNKTDEAAKYYKKAANNIEDKMFTPYYLKEAGDYLMSIGKYNEAEEIYIRIQKEYPTSREGENISKVLEYVKYKKES